MARNRFKLAIYTASSKIAWSAPLLVDRKSKDQLNGQLSDFLAGCRQLGISITDFRVDKSAASRSDTDRRCGIFARTAKGLLNVYDVGSYIQGVVISLLLAGLCGWSLSRFRDDAGQKVLCVVTGLITFVILLFGLFGVREAIRSKKKAKAVALAIWCILLVTLPPAIYFTL